MRKNIAKYRGKCESRGIWCYGFFHQLIDGRYVISSVLNWFDEDRITSIVVDPNTVGQFTGQVDKTGTEIYEGDSLRIPSGISGDYKVDEHITIVEWEAFGCEIGFYECFPDCVSWEDCEVINTNK